MASHSPVLFDEFFAVNGKKVAVATLNNSASLNALTLPMIELLQKQLDHWWQDEAVVCVFVQGAGERAFCAGGDVVSLYPHAAGYGEPLISDCGQRFFAAEYRLDYTIQVYPKPIVVWGDGVVMGGGIGLMVGASHRVVTETTRMAMPECAIGLYPDVGAGWFLNRMPGACGRFLALTGVSVNAADGKYLGLADYCINNNQKGVLQRLLKVVKWSADAATNGRQVANLLSRMESSSSASFADSGIAANQLWIDQQIAGSLPAVVSAIVNYAGSDKLLCRAADAIGSNCPASLQLADEQLRRSARLSLSEVFRQDLVVSTNCMKFGHFKEGVRALLMDKDCRPCWQPTAIESVSAEHIQQYFQVPWQGKHPLADLK